MMSQSPFSAKITLPLCLAILAVTFVALASAHSRRTRYTPAVASSLGQTNLGKDTRITDFVPAPNDEEIRKIRTADEWHNPYVMVYRDAYELILHDQARTEARLSLAELEATILKMPRERWPLGRVVAVQEIALRSAGDDAKIAVAMKALKRMLQSHKVRVDRWPTA
jgi:hypothetical protein